MPPPWPPAAIRPANPSFSRTPHLLLSKLFLMNRLRLAMFLLGITFWLGMAVFGLFLAGTRAHRYPEHISVFGILFPALAFVLVWTAWMRKRKRSRNTPEVTFGISEAGVRVQESVESNKLIPWDQIVSARYSKALGIIVVRSPLLNGRHLISRWEQQGREPGAFEKAAALIEKSIGPPRWRERWI